MAKGGFIAETGQGSIAAVTGGSSRKGIDPNSRDFRIAREIKKEWEEEGIKSYTREEFKEEFWRRREEES